MQGVVIAPGMAVERRVARLPGPWSGGRRGRPLRSRPGRELGAPAALAATRGPTFGVEYLVRQARITDIDRLATIGRASITRSGPGSLDAADLMRQLVYLPNASLLVAEVRRALAG